MKKLYNIFTLLAVALVGLSLTACSEKDYDTNPYNKSGINLLAFGPSPNTRSQEIRITGTNLTAVEKVIFPGGTIERAGQTIKVNGAEVLKANFNSVNNENIYVNIPEETVPGQIKLVAGNDTITSEGTLTFKEPIEVTSITPVTGLNAEDEISIKGDYVYNIAEVIFPSGVAGAPVAAEEFTYVSRKEIRLRVPLAAESGIITMNDGAEWELEYKDPIEVITASVTSITPSADFGQEITITGINLHTVESVLFPGGVPADFTVSADNKTITTTVPAECKSGALSLVLYSGAAVTTDVLSVPEIKVNEEKFTDVRVGDIITLTGENLDRVIGVSLPGIGDFLDYTTSANQLTFTVPEDMGDGNIVITQNQFLSATVKVMMYSDAPEVAIWAGEFVCAGWAGNQDLAWGGFDWTTIAPGTKLRFYYKKNTAGAWGCISLRHGDSWGNLPAPIPGQYDLSDDEGMLEVTFTQEVLADIIANGGLVITGDNFTLSKVTYPIPETVLWAGEFVCAGWAGNQDLAWGGFDWSTIAANSTISFTYKKNTAGAWGCISLRHGDSWGNLPDPIPGQYDLSDDEGVLEVKFPQNVLDDIIANGGLVITGDNYTLTRVTAK